MKKLILSLAGGSFAGLLLSFLFMNYESTSYEILNQAGVAKRTVKDIDIDFIFNAALFVVGCSIVIYVTWTYIEKNIDDKFYNKFKNK